MRRLSLEGKHARICGHTRAFASSVSHRIWEGLRRLLAEIRGRRLLEELTDKHATGSGVEEAPCPSRGEEKRPYPARGVEKLRGVESKFNEQDPFTGATQFRLLFLQDFTRNYKNRTLALSWFLPIDESSGRRIVN
jgi:hypothetical protein